ncbi:MAG TPA: DUF4294 domain-containing protein [Bacteroidales bacterium]|nr:DUF4294 domain-containing protein [Bacteroidales bacterium]
MRSYSIIFLILISGYANCQDTIRHFRDSLPDKFYILENVTRNGETLPEITLDEVNVTKKMDIRQRFQWWRYQRLVYNVKRVYPYSVLVRDKLVEVNDTLTEITVDSERRQYLRKFEKDVFSEYEDDLKRMTITQGRILIKLIDRETQNSSYDLIKEYRGTFSAAFWQGIARIFGSNLKSRYAPFGEDYLIEKVIYEIEAGRI